MDEGEIVALIGANGAGKTTTLKTISGVRPVRQGRVRLDGRDITHLAGHRRVGLGLSPGTRGAGDLSRDDRGGKPGDGGVRPPGGSRRLDFDRVFELFPRLAERRRQSGGTLSGGEQQMLAIGRALMAEPKVLLLDEPSMGLAPKLVSQIFSIIKAINSQGTTVLLVEQNAVQALTLAHRAYVLEIGQVVLSAPAAELLANESVRAAYLGGAVPRE